MRVPTRTGLPDLRDDHLSAQQEAQDATQAVAATAPEHRAVGALARSDSLASGVVADVSSVFMTPDVFWSTQGPQGTARQVSKGHNTLPRYHLISIPFFG